MTSRKICPKTTWWNYFVSKSFVGWFFSRLDYPFVCFR